MTSKFKLEITQFSQILKVGKKNEFGSSRNFEDMTVFLMLFFNFILMCNECFYEEIKLKILIFLLFIYIISTSSLFINDLFNVFGIIGFSYV